MLNRRPFYALALTLALTCTLYGQKKPLDHSVYDGWNSIRGTSLSDDGKWLLYTIAPQEGDSTVQVKSVDGSKSYTIDRGGAVSFTDDCKYVVATVVPPLADTKKARRDKVKPEDQPKNMLVILDLTTGQKTELPRITTYTLPADDSGWIVYKPEPPKPEPAKPGAAAPATTPPAGEAKKDDAPKPKADHKPGDLYVLRNIASGTEEKLENVGQFRFNKTGNTLVYTVSTKDGSGDGVVWYDLSKGQKHEVAKGLGLYPKIAIDEKGDKIAFTTDKDSYAEKKPTLALYLYSAGMKDAKLVAKDGAAGMPEGWTISSSGEISFSKKGENLYFNTVPKPMEEKKDDTPDDEKVSVDIWTWTDPVLQPQQLLQMNMEKLRSYTAVYHLGSNRIAQLETLEMPSVSVSEDGDGNVALGSSSLPYREVASWDTGYSDFFLVDVNTGKAKSIAEKFEGRLQLSPHGKYVYGYDPASKDYFAVDTRSSNRVSLNKDIPFPIWNELNDVPGNADEYGSAGWTKDDKLVLIYDNFDIWAVDPSGKTKPINWTSGQGRANQVRLRYFTVDREEDFIPTDKPVMLSAFNDATKAAGFYSVTLGQPGSLHRILMEDKFFGQPIKAKNANQIAYSRQDFIEYPDVWLADDLNFTNPRKISNANPQQANYNWGKAELVTWTSNDGTPLQGILIKPENFDYTKKYPMITYFYERSSDTLNRYNTPAPSASTINLTMYASNGYCVFVPDIPYKTGYPGESAMSAIMPGVQSILNKGFVDPKRLGIQGQSWGGYQVAYLVTETNMFACAEAGAPVGDMFSAYGGIRYGSGVVRESQYEKGQSRIDGTPWNSFLRYVENSPVFFADKVKTPLMIMSNDKDGAVPHTQGIELFTALRRLSKPSWLVVYNNEDHNLVERKNRKDLSVRLQQFFDHYLKGAPMPVWMAQGIPATMKGKTYGFEPVPEKKG